MVTQQIGAIVKSYHTEIEQLAARKGLIMLEIDISPDSIMGVLVEAEFVERSPNIGSLNVELKGTPEQVRAFLDRLQDA